MGNSVISGRVLAQLIIRPFLSSVLWRASCSGMEGDALIFSVLSVLDVPPIILSDGRYKCDTTPPAHLVGVLRPEL